MEGVWSEFYSNGFFGYGLKGDYQPFGLDFFIPLILMVVSILLIKKHASFFKNWKYEEKFRIIFVSIMILVEMSYFWRLAYVGPGNTTNHTMLTKLPLQVCQWTLLISSFMMLSKDRKIFPLTFYLCNSANIIALFMAKTVISNCGPSYYRYYQFWLEHTMPVIGNYYMLYVYDYNIKLKEIYKPFLFLVILSIPCIYMNLKYSCCDYMYLKLDFATFKINPDMSFHDIMVRIPIYALIMIVLFTLVYFVYYALNHKKGQNKL